jgi:hypothetical protein
MTLRTCARGLLASTTTVMILAGGTGIARAEPDPDPPPLPPAHNQLVPIPRTFVNPSNEGQPTDDSGGVGMVCENLLVGCR